MSALKWLLVRILTLEARLVLLKYRPQIIAVTGSVGKTTTKDAIYEAIRASLYVRKSERSFNSDIGVPLTILGLENAWRSPLGWAANLARGLALLAIYRPYPAWLVIEIGADRPRDIRRIAAWLKPKVAVITGVPEVPVHVEFFDSVEDLVSEKISLVAHLRHGGKVVLNGDDTRVRELVREFRGASITYGFDASNEYGASRDEILYEAERPTGVGFRMEHSGSSLPIRIRGALGRPKVYAALAALAVADIVGVDLVSSSEALARWVPPPGRMRLIDGLHGSIIIDDTYNSSPAAVLAALDTLREVGHAKRKIAVLGDMLELGKYSAEAHRAVGERVAACASVLYTFGLRARSIAAGAVDSGMLESKISSFDPGDFRTLETELLDALKPGDIVLVKGSQGMRLERLVKALMLRPEEASRALVRQESGWRRR